MLKNVSFFQNFPLATPFASGFWRAHPPFEKARGKKGNREKNATQSCENSLCGGKTTNLLQIKEEKTQEQKKQKSQKFFGRTVCIGAVFKKEILSQNCAKFASDFVARKKNFFCKVKF